MLKVINRTSENTYKENFLERRQREVRRMRKSGSSTSEKAPYTHSGEVYGGGLELVAVKTG